MTTVSPKAQSAFMQWVSRQPVLFPLVAVAHILACIQTAISAIALGSAASWYWLQPTWMLLYTASWLGVCSLKKWGLYSYIFLTTVNTVVSIAVKDAYWNSVLSSNLFLFDIVFSFFLILYIRKFDSGTKK